MSISISTTTRDDTLVVAVAGEVDVSNAAEMRQALDEALGKGPQAIEVDLAAVPYIDSTGIGVLVGATHRAAEAGVRMSVARPQRNVARVLSLLGVGEELGVRS